MTKLKNSKGDKTWKLKMWQNSKNQIVTKLKNYEFDMKFLQNLKYDIKQTKKCDQTKKKMWLKLLA